jgi:hypothetical protein
MRKLLGFTLFLGVCHAGPALAATPVSELGASTFSVVVAGQSLRIPYDANQSLAGSATVVRAVVIIPGSNRNCDYGYDTAREAATSAGMNNSTSLLVAPQFLVEDDIVAHDLASDRLFWEEDGWKEGDASLSTSEHPRPGTISSFAVLDSLLYRIAAVNPNLESIVIAGHSAGGQFVNHYAVGTRIPQTIESQFGVPISFVVANPGSYLYLNSKRLVSGTSSTFAVPGSPGCSYDRYKYGFQSRNGYMAAYTTWQLASQYKQRHVTYLLGQEDNDPAHPELDVSCSASLQGESRLARGRTYMKHLADFFGEANMGSHSKVEVPGVGHDSRAMFTSACGVSALFSVGGCSSLVDVTDEPEAPAAVIPGVRLWNEPNPFRGKTRVLFTLPDARSSAKVDVYDVRGRLVRTLESGPSSAGIASIVWDGRGSGGERLSAGVYFLRLENAGVHLTRRVTLLR